LALPINIENLNKVFDSRIRLGIMSALMVNTEVSYNELKELLQVTDGNLASHMKGLEENGFVKVQKGFIGRKTSTMYSATKAGEKAFRQHLEALEQMIKNTSGK
jgi:DNA-binding MarR family transcriptional regulator